jgi:LCP family protein required for cell wall assembly
MPDAQTRAGGIALRRGLTMLGMTLLVPGSAQLVAGNERIGRIATRIWLSLIAVGILFGLLFLVANPVALAIVANPFSLQVLRFAILLLGAGWVFLLLNAWRIANPAAMTPRGRMVLSGTSLVLAFVVGFASWNLSSSVNAVSGLVSTVFGGGGTTETNKGRYNVLLLGGDAGADRVGLRPDTMIVASIDANTGRTVLFSLPRNLQWAPFPDSSPLKKLYPNGYWCADQSCLLNAVYTLAENHKNLYPGVKRPGVQGTKEVIENILGLKINYWAMIDLKGFEGLINALGGIRLDVPKKVPIGSKNGPKGVYGYVGPGKNLQLNGFQALWFARSREGSTDYERMARQKCVLNAMVKQLNPGTVLAKFNDIAAAGEQIVATDLPTHQLGTMLDLAGKGRSLPLASVNFAPPLILPVKPDFPRIREIVAEQVATSEASGTKTEEPKTAEPKTAEPTATTSPATRKPTTTNKPKTSTDDLDTVCKVS